MINTMAKQYLNLFNSSIDLVLVNESITQLNFAQALVNCTGPQFQHRSELFFLLLQDVFVYLFFYFKVALLMQ
jgi:hypothetical protein